MKFNESSLLTILIPTRNRAKNLDNTLRRITRSFTYSGLSVGKIEIVVVNNFSQDNTEEVVNAWAKKFNYIKYYKHDIQRNSAEQSLFYGVKYATGKYVWSFGDDDFMHLDAIKKLVSFLENEKSKFVLLNCDILVPEKKSVIQYMRSDVDKVRYDQGYNLFKDFGLISVTTTLSCLVFSREHIDISLFKKLSDISSIYSHSFFLFLTFYNKECSFLPDPILTYKANTLEEEGNRITSKSLKDGNFELFSFTVGLIKLIEFVSKNSNVRREDIFLFEEMEISKTNWNVKHSLLIGFILRMFNQQLRLILKRNIFYKAFYRKKILEFCDLYIAILSSSSLSGRLDYHSDNIVSKIKRRAKRILFRYKAVKKSLKLLDGEIDKIDKVENDHFVYSKNLCDNISYFPVVITNSGLAIKALSCQRAEFLNQDKKGAGGKTLTILIPTYQRPLKVLSLLSKLVENKIDIISDIEIMIAINHKDGEDITLKISQIFSNPKNNIIYKSFDSFAPSAEDNINRSIEFCNGKYVYMLGDDDELSIPVFLIALEFARSDFSDVMLFNSGSNFEVGSIGNGSSPGFAGIINRTNNFTNLIRKYGITNSMSFISRYVIKKELLKDMSQYLLRSRVYAHVFSFMSCFEGYEIATISLPICFRGDSEVTKRFNELIKNDNKKSYYYWTIGLLEHIRFLQDSKIVGENWFFRVREVINKNVEFYLWKDVMKNLCMQSINFLESQDLDQIVSKEDIILLTSFNQRSLSFKERESIQKFVMYCEDLLKISPDDIGNIKKHYIKKFRFLIDEITA